MPRRKQVGFTLIELMVTLAVAAVLAFVAAPTINDLIVKSRLRGATDDIVNLLNASRINSVKLQRQINVSVDKSSWCAGAMVEAGPTVGSGDALSLATTACDCTLTSGSTACFVDSRLTSVTSSGYSGVTITSVSASNIASSDGGVTFNPKLGAFTDSSGNLLSSNPTVTLVSGKFSTQVTVSPLGQTQVCVPSSSPFVSGYPSC